MRKPAHSSAMYEAPTTSVLRGGVAAQKMSSLVMQHSLSPVEGREGATGLGSVGC